MKARVELPEEIAAMDHDIEVAVYRSAQEALHNIAKHSQARNFVVRLNTTDGEIHLVIEDDGTGVLAKAPDDSGFGLTGMRERAVALGGSMTIESRRGRGTQIRIILPFSDQESSTRETKRGGRAVRRASTAKAS
jgi:signal transduction histidine kinase